MLVVSESRRAFIAECERWQTHQFKGDEMIVKICLPPLIMFMALYVVWFAIGRPNLSLEMFWGGLLIALFGMRAFDYFMEAS